VLQSFRSGLDQSIFAISAKSEISGVIVDHRTCVSTKGAARVAPESLSQILNDLEVGYVDYIMNACAGAYTVQSGTSPEL
jgi:hypothetical protein